MPRQKRCFVTTCMLVCGAGCRRAWLCLPKGYKLSLGKLCMLLLCTRGRVIASKSLWAITGHPALVVLRGRCTGATRARGGTAAKRRGCPGVQGRGGQCHMVGVWAPSRTRLSECHITSDLPPRPIFPGIHPKAVLFILSDNHFRAFGGVSCGKITNAKNACHVGAVENCTSTHTSGPVQRNPTTAHQDTKKKQAEEQIVPFVVVCTPWLFSFFGRLLSDSPSRASPLSFLSLCPSLSLSLSKRHDTEITNAFFLLCVDGWTHTLIERGARGSPFPFPLSFFPPCLARWFGHT